MTQMQQILKDIEPILMLVSALLSVAVIGFVIKLSLFMKVVLLQRIEVLKDMIAVTEERRLKEKEDRIRVEQERDKLKQQLTAILDRANVTIDSLVANPSLDSIKQEVTKAVQEVLREMHEIETEAHSIPEKAEDHLELAKASTVAGNWRSAAKHYEEYVRVYSDNWEIHFLRAIAYANMSRSRTTNLASLRAYGDAIALAPDELDINTRARLHTYRGAILKRLERLDEALSDLLLAQKWASKAEEVIDNQYNLACVYALRRDKENMMRYLQKLSLAPQYKHTIRHSPYFQKYRNDEDFESWID